MNFTPAPAHPRRKARARTGAMIQPPPPVFEIPTRNRFAALCETECNAVVIGDSIVRNVRASSTKGKVRTHCFPGARVLDVSAQVPAILKDDDNVGAVVLHAGVNDVRMRQLEILKRDFRSLIETVRNASPTARIIVSGPLPTYRRGNEKFSRLFALNKWLMSWCIEQKLLFVIILICSGSDLGSSALTACTPAASERFFCLTTSQRRYAPLDYVSQR
ncbi:uncharacterized protein LOC130557097 [Triplophysa rosa]|uniref:uncharacterized protein LOC130557097 n=1 Tax=Triplophysa rosa TaxID=992332 RepID=UPI002545E05D|nr:uncharacterized protein LOC130557097 [Triplophysa rosa]XP_057194691.1 uncharacterized protein LOC130557097 [Triplophysa rosa]